MFALTLHFHIGYKGCTLVSPKKYRCLTKGRYSRQLADISYRRHQKNQNLDVVVPTQPNKVTRGQQTFARIVLDVEPQLLPGRLIYKEGRPTVSTSDAVGESGRYSTQSLSKQIGLDNERLKGSISRPVVRFTTAIYQQQ